MMDESRHEEFARLRDAYAQQPPQERDALVEDVAEGEVDLRSMESEHDNEVEERAQQADAARMFAHLNEYRKQRIEEQHQMVLQYVTDFARV
jgi:hypothetical protein